MNDRIDCFFFIHILVLFFFSVFCYFSFFFFFFLFSISELFSHLCTVRMLVALIKFCMTAVLCSCV